MANKWTSEQQSAIDSRNQNLLLSAAAGSGKTAVLVGRIISRLTDEEHPVKADRLLVVTFTNAAAAEMRERIIRTLTALSDEKPDNMFLADQLLLVKKAQITTIDSFCIDLLRKNFVAAGISPDFRIADVTENTVILDEVLDEVLTEMYDDEQYADAFFMLLESYANAKANDKQFRELILSVYQFAMSLPDPAAWLCDAADMYGENTDFSKTPWYDIVLNDAKTELSKCITDYDYMIFLALEEGLDAYAFFLKEEQKQLRNVYNAGTSYDVLKSLLEEFRFRTRPSIPKDMVSIHAETIHGMRDKIKTKRMRKLREKILILTESQQSNAIRSMSPMMHCLSEIVIRLSEQFARRKQEKNMLDFSDCEHQCLKILIGEDGKPSEVADEVRAKYDEIYIDEYQDTSKLQEAIFSKIMNKDNLFIVGDIKQSIYRFRNTDPSLFKNKRDSYKSDENAENRKIILSKNFRSRGNVLSSVNYIFERIMTEESGEIDYNEEEKLYPGAVFPDTAVNPLNFKTELLLLDVSSVKDLSEDMQDLKKDEMEAMLVADKIVELIESQVQIFADGEYRPIQYNDICVVTRNTKSLSRILTDVFTSYGIPCYSENVGGFLESSEIRTALSMLSVIDNPYQDLPLLTVLRSVMFGFTSDMLAKVRCCDKKGSFYEALIACSKSELDIKDDAKSTLDFIHTLIKKSKQMSVSQLIQDIYTSTGFYDAQQSQRNGNIRKANLLQLYNCAKEYESTGLKGLYSFIRFINDYKMVGGDFNVAKNTTAVQDAVQIMSIHKSKGLEFPVVILFGMERKFNLQDLHKGILFHADMGFGPKFVDTELRITYPFAPRVAVENRIRAESIAEEMRVLYVAMTRAKEKLILVGAVPDVAHYLDNCKDGGNVRKISPNIVTECDSYLDWVMTALLNHPDCKMLRDLCSVQRKICMDDSRFSVTVVDDLDLLLPEESASNEISAAQDTSEVVDRVLELVAFQYPYLADTVLPSKITVTELKQKSRELDEEGSVYLFQPEKMLSPRKKQLSAAQIGTAHHVVMQHIDLTKPLLTKDEVRVQIQRIQEDGFLTEEEAGAVNAEKIAKFFASNVGQMVLSSDRVVREVMFGITEPGKKLLDGHESDKPIMLQGVIDCVTVNEDGLCIIDYKTDRVFSTDDTVEKYKVQLACYKMAAERIFHKKVTAAILYLFDTDMAVFL